MGKEGGREIVTPRRRVQRQGNERLPALHHAQGLPQSAGGRGEMPHVSALLAPLLASVRLGPCGSEEGSQWETKGFPIATEFYIFLAKTHSSPERAGYWCAAFFCGGA